MLFDATGVTGVTKYALTNNVSGVNNTLSDVASLADVEVSGTAGTSTLAVGYTATSTVATGTQTDVQNLKVTNVGTIDTDATSATNAKYMTVDIDKVETLAITTAGTSNSLDLSASADTKTITVAGEGTKKRVSGKGVTGKGGKGVGKGVSHYFIKKGCQERVSGKGVRKGCHRKGCQALFYAYSIQIDLSSFLFYFIFCYNLTMILQERKVVGI